MDFLELRICRSSTYLVVVVCIVPRIPTMIIMVGGTIHPSRDKSGCRIAYLSSFLYEALVGNLSLQ